MFMDVAIKSDVLVAGLRNQLRAIPICISQLGPLLSNLMFDHVEIDTPTVDRVTAKVPIRLGDGTPIDVSGHRVRLKIPLRIYLASVGDVRAGGVNGPSKAFALHLELLFDLFGELQTDPSGGVVGAGIRVDYAGKDTPLPDTALDAQVESLLEGASQFVPLDLGPLETAFEKPVAIRNFGIATNSTRSRIVIRAEVDTVAPGPVDTWKAFFSSPPDHLAEGDWALMIDRRLLLQIAVERAKDSLSASKKTKIDEGPTADWLPGPASAGIRLETYIMLVDACPELGIDIGVDVEAVTTFTLGDAAVGKELRFSNNISWDATDSDVILCGLALGFIGTVTGSILGGASGGPVGAAIGAAVGLIATVVTAAIVADATAPPSSQMQQPGCKTVEEDDDHVKMECRRPLELPENPLLGKLVPDELIGDPLGLLLRGTSSVPDLEKELILKLTPMGWEQKLSCNSHMVVTSQVGSVELLSWPELALKVCGVEVVDDPLGYFKPTLKGVAGNSHFRIDVGINSAIALGLPPTKIDDDYRANPYPCRLLIRTSHGARFLDLGSLSEAPAPPDPIKVIKALGTHCFREYNRFYNARLDPDWVIEVHPGDIVKQQWTVIAAGLPPGSGVELVDRDGQSLASGGATRHGIAHAQAVVAPERGFSIRRTKAAQDVELGEFDPEVHRLAITQRLLTRHRLLFLPGACRALAPFWGVGRWQLAAVSDAGLLVWDQHPAGGLAPVTLLRDLDLRGLTPLGGGFVAYGPAGLYAFRAEEDGQARPVAAVREGDVADAIMVAGRLYTLAQGRLEMFTTELAGRRSLEIGNVESLTPTADGVAVKSRGATEMIVYGPAADGDLRKLRKQPPETGAAAESERGPGLRPRGLPTDAAESTTEGSQWLAQTIAVSPWLAHLAPDLTSLELYARTPPAQPSSSWPPGGLKESVRTTLRRIR